MADAGTLRCPSCGAPAGVDGHLCAYCRSTLLLVACPKCLGRLFRGSRHCPHCGARADRVDDLDAPEIPCPRCEEPLSASTVGEVRIRPCGACGGIWIDRETLNRLLSERADGAAPLLAAIPAAAAGGVVDAGGEVRYVPCPDCRKLMTRRQFSRSAKVVLDVCRDHGTWFDRDELSRIVAFIRDGGLDADRKRERDDIRSERADVARERAKADTRALMNAPVPMGLGGPKELGSVVDLGATLVKFLGKLF